MVSGKNSKAVRNARSAVVTEKSTPWGLIAGALVVLLFAGGVFGFYLNAQAGQADERAALAPFVPSAENPDPSTQIEGVQVVEYAPGQQHYQAPQQVAYTTTPPIGGGHDGVWAACNGVVYDQPVRNESLVHSLEHGAVWITYNADQVTGEALATLQDKVDGEQYMVMSPYPDLDSPISMQSWGHQLKLDDADDPRIDQFITALRINQYTHPEFGASCEESGPGGFERLNPPPFAPAPAPGTPGAEPEVTAGAAGVAPDAAPAGS